MPRKGQKMGEEFREKKRQELLKRWKSPGYRENISAKLQGHPVSESVRQRVGDIHRGKPLTEEHKAKMAASSKRLWQDTGYAEKVKSHLLSADMKAKKNLPAARAIISTKKAAFWAAMAPEERAERCKKWLAAGTDANRGVPRSPEVKAKCREAALRRLQTDEGREHIAALREASLKCTRNTRIEQAVAVVLNALGIAYEQSKMIGPYEADFFIPAQKLVLECDGTYWHGSAEQQARDRRRDGWFKHHGYRVVRLPEVDIHADAMDCVCRAVHQEPPQ